MKTTSALLASVAMAVCPGTPGALADDGPAGTIAFASLAPRGWDLYALDVETRFERRLTDHTRLDYNAAFSPDGARVAFVSERDGIGQIYVADADGSGIRRVTESFGLDDTPAWSPDGRRIVFSSTRESAGEPGRAWNALYVMDADGSNVRRLTPPGVSDYSPVWSPKGDLIAFASGSGEAGKTDLYVVAPDGSGRRKVLDDGGWPAFTRGGHGLVFHARRDGRWAVWIVGLDGSDPARFSPEDHETFTPSTSADGRWLVGMILRDGRRQIARVDLVTGNWSILTEGDTDHWNPTISPDGRTIAYHRRSMDAPAPDVEAWAAPPGTGLRLLRLSGSFPAFSPDGGRLAFVGDGFSTLEVMGLDGSGRETIYEGKGRGLFSVSWSHRGEDRIAFSEGPVFQGAAGEVEIVSVRPDGADARKLTDSSGNDGFPSYSPDGSRLVFRSGRHGAKNLYTMKSDGTEVRRLTDGDWTDTMADWSPTGDWIAFASDRDGDFDIWLVHPDGTGLKKLVSEGGRDNHPHFSPDGRWIVFTSKRAGFSAEEISLPDQPQPYGDLFAVRLDGTGLIRLTHNGTEEGTPAWGPSSEKDAASDGHERP
jgi:Tol biopolymer transport system component